MPYSLQKLAVDPYARIIAVDSTGAPGSEVTFRPPLGSGIESCKFAPTDDKMALVYNLRREETIGDPDNPPPDSAVVLTSRSEGSILFGGSALALPVIYKRTTPSFTRAPSSFPLPTAAGLHYTFGATSPTEDRFALVRSDTPTIVTLYVPADGVWTAIGSINATATITGLEFSPQGTYLVVHTAAASVCYDPVTRASKYAPGKPILAIHNGDVRMVIEPGTPASNLLQVVDFDGSTATAYGTVPASLAGTGGTRLASFSPDGLVLSAQSGGSPAVGPAFYADHEGVYVQTRSNARSTSGTWKPLVWSRDSSKAAASVNVTEHHVELFARATELIESFASHALSTTQTNSTYSDISPDGQIIAIGGAAGTLIYRWNGTDFALAQTITGYPNLVKFSPDGTYLVVANTSTSVRVHKNASGTFTQVANLTTSGTATTNCVWSPSGNEFVVCTTGGTTSPALSYVTRAADVFTLSTGGAPSNWAGSSYIAATLSDTTGTLYGFYATGSPNRVVLRVGTGASGTTTQTLLLPAGTSASNVIAFSHDGAYLFVPTSAAPFLLIYKRTGVNSFSTTPISGIALSTQAALLSISNDGARLATAGLTGATGSSWIIKVYEWSPSAETLTFKHDSGTTYTGLTHLSYSADAQWLLASSFNTPYVALFKEAPPISLPTYNLLNSYAPTASEIILEAFSPGGTELHGRGDSNFHVATSTPFAALPTVSFASTYDPAQISNVTFSKQGNIVTFKYGNNWKVSAINRGSYTNLSDLNGTFVSTYALNSDVGGFVEIGFAQHDAGTEVTHMVWGLPGTALSYFALNTINPASETQGRFVYGVNDVLGMYLGGVIWSEDMLDSYLAFDVSETRFVTTFRRNVGDNDIFLCRCLNTGMEFEQWDREVVAFGPCDFSACDEVVVAHGGNPNPFSLFRVVDHDLVPEVLPNFDWGHDGIILDVKFEDCDNLAVLTPTEVVEVSKGEEGMKDEDSGPRSDSGGNSISIHHGPPNVIHVDAPSGGYGGGYGGGGSSGGGWSGGLTPVGTIPYVAINVFYGD